MIDRLCRLALDYYEMWASNPHLKRKAVSEPLPFHDRRMDAS